MTVKIPGFRLADRTPEQQDFIDTWSTLLRGYTRMRVLAQTHGIYEVTDGQRRTWHLLDVKHVIEHWLPQLASRQHQAVLLGLVLDLTEEEMNRVMGLKPGVPSRSYVTNGLLNLYRLMHPAEQQEAA